MVKIGLQIKGNLDSIENIATNQPDYHFRLKLKCLNCGEISDKWHDIIESETFPSKTARSDVNYVSKCKLCSRENSLDIIKDSIAKYASNDQGKFKTIVQFDCRGIEPVEFQPCDGWIAVAEDSGKVYEEVDLSEKEWVDYDDREQRPVGVYELESQFIKIK